MSLFEKDGRTILFSLSLLVAVPVLFHPYSFGINDWVPGPQRFVFELAYYTLAFSLMFSKTSLLQLWRAILVAFGFRLTCGTFFGILAAPLHSIPLGTALSDGWYRYLPVVLIQTTVIPFILRNWLARWIKKAGSLKVLSAQPETGLGPFQAQSINTGHAVRKPPFQPYPEEPVVRSVNRVGRAITWNDALAFIGEYPGVQKSFVVDHEGLPIVSWFRDQPLEDDIWVGLSLEFWLANEQVLQRVGGPGIDRLELSTRSAKIFLHRIGELTLITVADPATDELVNVRLSKAAEMIAEYTNDRKARLGGSIKVEEQYVPGVGVAQ